jgi:hypothetical protein
VDRELLKVRALFSVGMPTLFLHVYFIYY